MTPNEEYQVDTLEDLVDFFLRGDREREIHTHVFRDVSTGPCGCHFRLSIADGRMTIKFITICDNHTHLFETNRRDSNDDNDSS